MNRLVYKNILRGGLFGLFIIYIFATDPKMICFAFIPTIAIGRYFADVIDVENPKASRVFFNLYVGAVYALFIGQNPFSPNQQSMWISLMILGVVISISNVAYVYSRMLGSVSLWLSILIASGYYYVNGPDELIVNKKDLLMLVIVALIVWAICSLKVNGGNCGIGDGRSGSQPQWR